MKWTEGRLTQAAVKSLLGNRCRVRCKVPLRVLENGTPSAVQRPQKNIIEFSTKAGVIYILERSI
jgi:alpha-L-fucosidase 2